jgi:hypothetical protein
MAPTHSQRCGNPNHSPPLWLAGLTRANQSPAPSLFHPGWCHGTAGRWTEGESALLSPTYAPCLGPTLTDRMTCPLPTVGPRTHERRAPARVTVHADDDHSGTAYSPFPHAIHSGGRNVTVALHPPHQSGPAALNCLPACSQQTGDSVTRVSKSNSGYAHHYSNPHPHPRLIVHTTILSQ